MTKELGDSELPTSGTIQSIHDTPNNSFAHAQPGWLVRTMNNRYRTKSIELHTVRLHRITLSTSQGHPNCIEIVSREPSPGPN